MPKHERTRREREGYVQNIDARAPSVISLNTTLAGLAVAAFLQLVTDFMAEQGCISRLNYDILAGSRHRALRRVLRLQP